MVKKLILFTLIALTLVSGGCKKDDPEPAFQHTGDKWAITSFNYALLSQKTNPVSVVVDAATVSNAGYFYFDGQSGSFDITVKSTHVEDHFTYTENGNAITATTISQSVGGGKVSQYVIAYSGSKGSTTTMTLEGSITKQSTSEQFSLSGTMTLVKQ